MNGLPDIDPSLSTAQLMQETQPELAPLGQNWGVEVKIRTSYTNGDPVREWRRLKPTDGQPYVYKTRAEAERIGWLCYGQYAEWRVVPLP